MSHGQLGVVCAALFLGGCATPLTVSTAPTPELPVERWRGLLVAAEHRCAPYRSDEYAYPQAVEDDIIQRLGGLFSPYTNEVFHSKRDTDIEHVVARSEAHDSGLCRADAATKRRFSRDLLNLTLASPRVNRNQKGAKDAAEWQPEANQCWFAQTVVTMVPSREWPEASADEWLRLFTRGGGRESLTTQRTAQPTMARSTLSCRSRSSTLSIATFTATTVPM